MKRLGHWFVAGWWLSLFSLIGACAFEDDRELGWLSVSVWLLCYFSIVIVVGKWWRVVRGERG